LCGRPPQIRPSPDRGDGMRSRVGRGTAARDLHALLAEAVLLLGMLVSIPLARSRVPLYPGDPAVYIGAY